MLISKKNEVYLVLENLSQSERQELSDFFTFEVPNAKFMPMVRNRMWDGKIRLFSPANGEIYVGLLPYIKEYCKSKNIKYNIEEGVEDARDIVGTVARGLSKASNQKVGEDHLKYETIKSKLLGWLSPEIVLLLLVLLLLVNHL